MSVVTISRQVGSLGTEIAQEMAKRLGYEYVDKERIGKALVDYGLPEPDMERFDERKPPFWDTWLVQRRKFLHFLQAVIFDFAGKGNVVIVGRGGQILLRDLPGVLHLRMIAPFEVRLRRMAGERRLDERQTERALRRSDRDSSGFIQSFFDVDWNSPDLYDLVLNTQKMTLNTAVEMVLQFVHSPEMTEGEKKAEEKISHLALIQRVEAALLGVLGIDIRNINIQEENGVITLRGAVGSNKDKESCERAVVKILGVKRVDSQLLVTEYYRFGT